MKHYYYKIQDNLICGDKGTLVTYQQLKKWKLLPINPNKFKRVLRDDKDVENKYGILYDKSIDK